MQKRDKPRAIENDIKRIMDGESRIIVFCETKRGCEDLRYNLQRANFESMTIHGDKQQRERDWCLSEFRNGSCLILIATDVASRGLDVKGIKYVINYDFPNQI